MNSHEKKRMIKMYTVDRKSLRHVADHYKLSFHAARDVLRDAGVDIRGRGPIKWKDPSKKPLTARAQEYVSLVNSGMRQVEVAKRLGVTRSSVSMMLKYHEDLGRIKRPVLKNVVVPTAKKKRVRKEKAS